MNSFYFNSNSNSNRREENIPRIPKANLNTINVNNSNLHQNVKTFSRRYTDVHANSKSHYLHKLDDPEKLQKETGQWNDRTNRYFYLKQDNNNSYGNGNCNYYSNNSNYDLQNVYNDYDMKKQNNFNANRNSYSNLNNNPRNLNANANNYNNNINTNINRTGFNKSNMNYANTYNNRY